MWHLRAQAAAGQGATAATASAWTAGSPLREPRGEGLFRDARGSSEEVVPQPRLR